MAGLLIPEIKTARARHEPAPVHSLDGRLDCDCSPDPSLHSADHPYQYFRAGNPNDVQTKTQAGFGLMGGGDDLDEAFKWMGERAGGGDFVVLSASGDEDYNPYIPGLCKLNSVATIILKSREAAKDPLVADTIRHAEAVFIAGGGDQAHYINWWMDTPVQPALNE